MLEEEDESNVDISMVLGYWLLLLLLLLLLLIPNVSLPLSPITVDVDGFAVGDGTNDAVVIPLAEVGLVVEVDAVMTLR